MRNDFIGGILGVALINGKMKPKYGIRIIISTIFVFLTALMLLFFLYTGIKTLEFESIIVPLISIPACIYWLLINPVLQKASNYTVELERNDSLENLKLYYKRKLVDIKYEIDKVGKIKFANNEHKLSCISYADGSKMSNFTKYRIINYFTKWLSEYKLLSDEVTITHEEL